MPHCLAAPPHFTLAPKTSDIFTPFHPLRAHTIKRIQRAIRFCLFAFPTVNRTRHTIAANSTTSRRLCSTFTRAALANSDLAGTRRNSRLAAANRPQQCRKLRGNVPVGALQVVARHLWENVLFARFCVHQQGS